MGQNLTHQLIAAHRVGEPAAVDEVVRLGIDQTLTQDATGTLAMLEFEAMALPRVRTRVSAQYVDHNLLQTDNKNADDHLFLQSACRKFGLWFSRPGNGVSHPVHMERFGVPGQSVLGSDSHTCAAGSLGMLAIGAGGLEVAMAMAGEPFHVRMPKVLGVKLTGRLPDWVSAKDVILEMLRRHGVEGGYGKVIEYHGRGVASLSAMDRHVIANMGAELGATTTVFPSDDNVRAFLAAQGREQDWRELKAAPDAHYDEVDEIALDTLEPLIACPSSPGNVVPVSEVAGREIYQAYIGSSANPGLRDFATAALMVEDRYVDARVSLDINPTSRQILQNLMAEGLLAKLLGAGARLHQAGCNGCIGMGQAPATHKISLRTVPRNFPGRSGTREDAVYLCSPETAAASALTGVITDPRTLDMDYPGYVEPGDIHLNTTMLLPPADDGASVSLEKGPNIVGLPVFEALPASLECPVLIKVGDDISTDAIMPAGSRVLPFRSNIPAISQFVFEQLDEDYYRRAVEYQQTGSFIMAGRNYGQGSSREHAALAPRYLGVRAVIAKGFARIHWQNLVNFAILPLHFVNEADYDQIERDDVLRVDNLRSAIQQGAKVTMVNQCQNRTIELEHRLSARQVEIILAGGLINRMRHSS